MKRHQNCYSVFLLLVTASISICCDYIGVYTFFVPLITVVGENSLVLYEVTNLHGPLLKLFSKMVWCCYTLRRPFSTSRDVFFGSISVQFMSVKLVR